MVSRYVSKQNETMPVRIDGVTVYRIGEALHQAGVSRATYFRWVREGRLSDVRYRDRNGRRVFTDEELNGLCCVSKKLVEASPQRTLALGAEADDE